jgi:hypothetical protein
MCRTIKGDRQKIGHASLDLSAHAILLDSRFNLSQVFLSSV